MRSCLVGQGLNPGAVPILAAMGSAVKTDPGLFLSLNRYMGGEGQELHEHIITHT